MSGVVGPWLIGNDLRPSEIEQTHYHNFIRMFIFNFFVSIIIHGTNGIKYNKTVKKQGF